MAEKQGLGWIRDVPKSADFRASAPVTISAADLPPSVELWTPPILDQGSTSSCVGHGSASLFRYMMHYLGQPDFQPSPLFNYWYARKISHMGWENEDNGAMPRDAMQSMISNGVVPEDNWAFDLARVNERPPRELLPVAYKHRIIEGEYVRMLANDNLIHLKYSLAKQLPFLVGIDCFTSLFDQKTNDTGVVPFPNLEREVFEGGHLVYSNGYITRQAPNWSQWLTDHGVTNPDPDGYFRCPNSWGDFYGEHGIYWFPFAYIRNASIASDFWRVQMITGGV